MTIENSTLNTQSAGQDLAVADVAEESSHTAANSLEADDAAIFGSVGKQASESVEKQTPVTTEQDEPPASVDGETQAVTNPPEGQTKKDEASKPDVSDEEIEAMPEEIRGKARRERQWNRLQTKIKVAEETAATERRMREDVEKRVREELAAKSAVQTPDTYQPPPEIALAKAKAFQEWNDTVAAVSQGTKSEADSVRAWANVEAAIRKEGGWREAQQITAAQQQRQMEELIGRERNEALSTIAELSADDARFDISDDLAKDNPTTPIGIMVKELCMKKYGRPVRGWAELEHFYMKAHSLVQKGQVQLVENKVKNAENQSRALLARVGLESSSRHAPPPRSVSTENGEIRKRLASKDPKVREAARYELFAAEDRAHGLA